MKQRLRKLMEATLGPLPAFEMERPTVKAHGELSTNLAMVMAKPAGRKPKELAQEFATRLAPADPSLLEKVEVAGGGFINFTLKKGAWQESLREIDRQGENFGRSDRGRGISVLVELVSANPTGPLHIGNARGGPLGDMIASLLEATGHPVTREYYVNDIGGQIDRLGESILYWIHNNFNRELVPPEGYPGDYVYELAAAAKRKFPEKINQWDQAAAGQFGIGEMTREIENDCKKMGIHFGSWVKEHEILSNKTNQVLQELKKRGVTIEKEGAVWFAPQDNFLEDRECVLVRSDGRPTYFANDIAYHVDKYRRGFDRIINIWGSNHHGHIPRLQAAMKSLEFDPDKMETVLYQYVRVKRGNELVKMSKRGGNFVTAREVLEEVGKDAFRFFLLMRAPESHLDFDLELAKKHSQENPVYYVQYAHARLASIFRKYKEIVEGEAPRGPARGGSASGGGDASPFDLSKLDLPEEIDLIRLLHEFPEEVEWAASRLQPHRIPFYLLELTKLFQSYYTKAKEDPHYRVLGSDIDTTSAKMYLCKIVQRTLCNGLKLMGVSAPEVMRS